MLNGKFYMGLPPGMIERGGPQRNRMQSSIFWPDDTKVDSAVETRVKRRNSLQIAQGEDRPRLGMQSSVSGRGDADVNTRQLFHKEFAKSSIEFLDNLGDETKARKPLLLRGNSTEVTPKPTAMKLPLPENVVNAGYTSAKKKQAFTSKIEFNDYMGDELNNRNNLRRPKMDMNDKKEMERNTKNSPKLQVKNNMRSLGADEKLYPATRREKVEVETMANTKIRGTAFQNNVREEVEDRKYERDAVGNFDDEFEEGRNGSAAIKASLQPRFRNDRLRELDYLNNRRTVSPEYGYRRDRRIREMYDDDYEVPDYTPIVRYGVAVRRSNSVGRFTSPPKRILKNNIRERRYYDDYNEPKADADLDYTEGRMRNMRIHTSPKKHVTYSDDTYSHDDEMPNQPQRRSQPMGAQSRTRATAAPPNMRTGSNQQRQQQQQQQELRRYSSEMDLVEDANEALEQKFMENDNTTTIKSLNIGSSYNSKNNNDIANEDRYSLVNQANKNRNNNYNSTISRLNNQTIASAARKITPKTPTAANNKANADTTANEPIEAVGIGLKKHLRSSLCLHNGEIIASDDGGATSTKAPTRSARSTATRQRISVGLPD